MKRRTILNLFCFVACAALSIACANEDPIIKVPNKVELENADELGLSTLYFSSSRASSQELNFTADGEWYIRVDKDCDWLKAVPSEGEGDATVSFQVTAHDALESRTTLVAFVCDGLEQKALLEVTQAQKFILEATVENTVIGKTGGDITFPVETNGTYDVVIEIGAGSDANWLTFVSSGSSSVTLNAKAIQGRRNTAVVKLICKEDPDTVYEFTLSQKNLQLSFNGTEVYARGEAVSAQLPVTVLNIDSWTAATGVDWCTAEVASGKVVLSFNENKTGKVRKATLLISTPEDEEIKATMAVTQYPAGLIMPDLCDIVYDEKGNATDISPKGSEVVCFKGNDAITISYYENYKRYAPSFSSAPGSSWKESTLSDKFGYYVDYTSFQAPFNDGYSVEAVFSIPEEHNGKESKAFGATGSGGFAIMLGNTSRGGSIEFIQHSGKGWCFGSTGIVPVPGQLYHVIGVYDPATASIYTYVDGELIVSVECPGFKHMNTTAKVLGVGANHTNAAANGSWNGAVVISRVYDAVMTADQVKAAAASVDMPSELYKQDVLVK